MNDEDQENLLIHVSESEDSSGESDAYLESGRVVPFVQAIDNTVNGKVQCCNKYGIEFLCSGALLVVASTFVVILLPSYSDAINAISDVYTLILFASVMSSAFLLLLICFSGKRKSLCKGSTFTKSFKPPFRLSLLVKAGFAQGIGGLLVLLSSDSKKVLCHLQDPMKGVSLVFALLFYFIFSKKVMGVQQIFCTTTMVVGLFVCLDYGLCDQFRCRGWEREHSEDDGGPWKRAVHFLAGSAYVLGLAIWTFHFSLIENGLASLQLAQGQNTLPNSNTSKYQEMNSLVPTAVLDEAASKPSALLLACWLHAISATVIVLFFWTDMIPYVGKASSWLHLENLIHRGFMCHIGMPWKSGDCGLIPILGWLFAAFVAIVSVSASNVLILSQSAVVTVALMTCALPLANIFWAFFRLPPASSGALEWWPSLTAELMCTLVGFPIVAAGLYLLCRGQLQLGESGAPRKLCCTLRFHHRKDSIFSKNTCRPH